MGTPFISISYEQKMKGFMDKINLLEYCIELNELSAKELITKFNCLEKNRDSIVEYLKKESSKLKKESHTTVEIIEQKMDELVK